MQGSPIVARVMTSAMPQLREKGIEIKISNEGSNSQAIAALGAGEIDVAMLTRALTVDESAAFPERQFEAHRIGTQVTALLVQRVVWESGVRALKRAQVGALYEGRLQNWKEVGGEDREVKFFEIAHGLGLWEMFANWVYGDVRKAPAVKWDVVENSADAATAVQFNSGAISVAALMRADRREVFPLALIDDAGVASEPTPANIAAGGYPLVRPAYVIFGDKPTGQKRKVLEFLLSEKGQEIVAASDLLPLAAVPKP